MIPYISRIFNVNVNRVAALYSTKSSQDKNEEPNGPNIKTEIPGPTSLSLLKKLKLYQDTENAEFFGNYEKSTGNYLVDADENVFLDLNMQHSRIPLGYNFKELTQVFSDPKSLHYITDTISMNAFPGTCCPSRIENIVDKVSPNLPNLYLCPCDSTAVEEGLKTIMSTYQNRLKEEESECGGDKGNTPNTVLGSQKLSILSFKNSQHGHTIGALNVSNADPWRKLDLAAFNWPVAYYPEYKYPLNEYVVYNAKQDRQSLAMIEDLIQKWQTKNQPIAGIIIEPLQNATNHVVSEHFLLDLEELTYKHGIYLMFDEIKTCCGATGKFWAHEHYCLNCPPDILTFGGKAQISGFLHRNDLKPLHTNRISPSGSMNVAKIVIFEAIIDFIEKRNLMRNVQLTGDLLRERLLDMEKRYIDLIHSTRGLGTVLAFDAHSSTIRDDLLRRLRKKGILCGKCGHQGLALRPALTFTKHHADIFINQLENALREMILLKTNNEKLTFVQGTNFESKLILDKISVTGIKSKKTESKEDLKTKLTNLQTVDEIKEQLHKKIAKNTSKSESQFHETKILKPSVDLANRQTKKINIVQKVDEKKEKIPVKTSTPLKPESETEMLKPSTDLTNLKPKKIIILQKVEEKIPVKTSIPLKPESETKVLKPSTNLTNHQPKKINIMQKVDETKEKIAVKTSTLLKPESETKVLKPSTDLTNRQINLEKTNMVQKINKIKEKLGTKIPVKTNLSKPDSQLDEIKVSKPSVNLINHQNKLEKLKSDETKEQLRKKIPTETKFLEINPKSDKSVCSIPEEKLSSKPSMSLKSGKPSKFRNVVIVVKIPKSIGSGSGSWSKEPFCVMDQSQFKQWPMKDDSQSQSSGSIGPTKGLTLAKCRRKREKGDKIKIYCAMCKLMTKGKVIKSRCYKCAMKNKKDYPGKLDVLYTKNPKRNQPCSIPVMEDSSDTQISIPLQSSHSKLNLSKCRKRREQGNKMKVICLKCLNKTRGKMILSKCYKCSKKHRKRIPGKLDVLYSKNPLSKICSSTTFPDCKKSEEKLPKVKVPCAKHKTKMIKSMCYKCLKAAKANMIQSKCYKCSKGQKKGRPEKLDISYEKSTASGSTNTIKSQCYNCSKSSKGSKHSKTPSLCQEKIKICSSKEKVCEKPSKTNKIKIVCSKCSGTSVCAESSKPKPKNGSNKCSGTVGKSLKKSNTMKILCFKCLAKQSTKKIKVLCYKCLEISKSPGPVCPKCSKPKPSKKKSEELQVDFNADVIKLCPNKCSNKKGKKLCPRPWTKGSKSSGCVCAITKKSTNKNDKC